MTDQMFMDLKTAAKACGVGPDTIRRAITSGALRAKRSATAPNGDPVGKHIISRDALVAWFEGLPDA